MIINLNGEKKEVPDSITVRGLLEVLKIQHQRVAVELNLEIVRKEKFDTMTIHEGDTLEVVSFMAGGVNHGLEQRAPDDYKEFWK